MKNYLKSIAYYYLGCLCYNLVCITGNCWKLAYYFGEKYQDFMEKSCSADKEYKIWKKIK